MSLDTGSLVSHYRIVRRLGAGGMGEVFLAQDLQLDRQVAIKFLKAGDDRSHKRLVQEARAAASLDHPFICAVYEVGSDPSEGDFIVMQFVEGESLAMRLQRQRLPPAEAIALCRRIAEALKAAHAQGIVHRDLKPQNVIITPAGEPKLLDFGIAKRILTAQAAAEADTTSQVTHPDAQVGTPAYMSPEQVRSHPADFRSDLFALGCVLYECLTGRRAFNGPTTPDVLGQVLHVEPPPPSTIVPELGTMYDPICARLLKKDPRERFQSADEVLGATYALTMAASPSAITATAKRTSTLTVPLPVTRTARIAAAIALVVLITGTFAVYRWARTVDLPTPHANAKQWYERGVEALRQGTYAAARAALTEAVRISDSFVEARWRLAEAESELDDEEAATRELAQAGTYIDDKSRLPKATRLRMDGISAAVLRQYDKAVESYRKLAGLNSKDEGAWVDIGRAEDGRGNTLAAREAYQAALKLNSDYAPAHVRLGASPGLPIDEATKEFDEAIRLYKLGKNREGEAEALIRKGVALNTVRRIHDAREALERAIELTGEKDYHSQQLRARFELSAVTRAEGHFDDATQQARAAVIDAKAERLYTIAASGLIDLGTALAYSDRYDEANAELVNAIHLASDYHAKRTEMRARLQQAAFRESTHHPADAVTLARDLLPFFADGRYPRNEAQTRMILARAYAALGDYENARNAAAGVLKIAEALPDDRLRIDALDLIQSQLSSLGQFTQALTYLEQVETFHRNSHDQDLAYDLTSHADLLIELGRGKEIEPLFEEIAASANKKIQAFVNRSQRVAFLRALYASVERRFGDAVTAAEQAIPTKTATDATSRFARILREHALAATGRSVTPTPTVLEWITQASTAMSRGEYSYWVGLTLLARRDGRAAKRILHDAWSDSTVAKSPELHWRLGSAWLAGMRALPEPADDESVLSRVNEDRKQLTTALGANAQQYFDRPDLKVLMKDSSGDAPPARKAKTQ